MDVTFQVCPIKLSDRRIRGNDHSELSKERVSQSTDRCFKGKERTCFVIAACVMQGVPDQNVGVWPARRQIFFVIFTREFCRERIRYSVSSLRCAGLWNLMSKDARSLNYSENVKFKKDARINSRFSYN